jgi:hypothetical protein
VEQRKVAMQGWGAFDACIMHFSMYDAAFGGWILGLKEWGFVAAYYRC